jgi:hypothetical protein
LFLRHRLQKGLLNRDSNPKEEEMKSMSEFLAKLESSFPELEASIIRATKINKVLKAILKLSEIPKEAEFNFKPRSQTLLEKWNKTLTAEPAAAGSTAPANGVNGTSDETVASKDTQEHANGVNGDAPKEAAKDETAESKDDAKADDKTELESKDIEMGEDKPAAEVSSHIRPVSSVCRNYKC